MRQEKIMFTDLCCLHTQLNLCMLNKAASGVHHGMLLPQPDFESRPSDERDFLLALSPTSKARLPRGKWV